MNTTPTTSMARTQPLVTLNDVAKVFDNGLQALDRVNLEIDEGDFICLLGPSGCGKSTVLRILAELAAPTEGSLHWSPSVARMANGKPEVGFVFQEPTLMPWATVAENVYLPFQLKDVPRRDAETPIREALERVGLSDVAGCYPAQLSGGMKMRVSIARALVAKPRLLLMDEPFAALDEITRTRLNRDLATVWRELGCTVVFVTHSVVESVQLASRIVVMAARPGRVVGELPGLARRDQSAAIGFDANVGSHCQQVSAMLNEAMAVAE